MIYTISRGGGDTSQSATIDAPSTESLQITPRCMFPERWSHPKRAIILMDGFAAYHGKYLTQVALEVYGVAVIHVLSTYMKGYFLKTGQAPTSKEYRNLSQVMPNTNDETAHWKSQLIPDQVDEIVAVIVESDSGLADAERLAVQANVTFHNGIQEARRNKYLMNQIVTQRAHLPTVQQRLCRNIEEAIAFAKSLGVSYKTDDNNIEDEQLEMSDAGQEKTKLPSLGLLGTGLNAPPQFISRPRCVVKPIRGVASDDVFLCDHLESVETAFHKILGSTVFGSPALKHDSVLVQEFASGTEYAIDIVSRDGQHKVAALWRYDKRPANGRSFVYHATELVDATSGIGKILFEYTKAALDALGLKWGLTHNEVILTSMGPRLVEVNCRQHNMDFCPIAMCCIGYNALDMLLSAYLGGHDGTGLEEDSRKLDWGALPDLPETTARGAMVHIVSSAQGVLLGINEDALNEISDLESVFAMELYPSFLELGTEVQLTVDIRTDAGWIQLINDDDEVFQRDYKRILELMPQIFIVDTARVL
jgi:hypothetical protein